MAIVSRKQPLYDQLVDALHDKIESEYAPGDLLPSERALSERSGLSRTTVRLALGELESMGLVVRKHGKGTFVADHAGEATNLMGTYSFTEQMRAAGRNPRTEILDFVLEEAPKQVAASMGIRVGDKVFQVKRLRLADDVPMMLERSYLPASEFVSLRREDLERKPLYDIIEKDYREQIRVAEEEFFASLARADEAEHLGIPEGSAVLRLRRTTHNTRNVVVEYTLSVARADQFRYKVEHYRA